jgi:CheY-like chemotaxis protein
MKSHQPTLLVVDDEPFNREIIAEFLATCDYRLVMAADGNEALDKLMADPESFDAVLLDRMMPGIDGIDVLRKIKQDSRLQMLPVIMQTASSSPDQIAEGLQYGAFYYLTKPFGQKVLQAVTATAIRDRLERLRIEDEQTAKYSAHHLLNTAEYNLRTRQEAHALAGLLSQLCPSQESAYMGLVELMLNAIEHGNLAITYDQKTELLNENRLHVEIERRLQLPNYSDRYATVSFARYDKSLVFTITDKGDGFEWEKYLEMSLDRLTHNHGRGIAISKSIAFSALEYQGRGNCVVATVTIDN